MHFTTKEIISVVQSVLFAPERKPSDVRKKWGEEDSTHKMHFTTKEIISVVQSVLFAPERKPSDVRMGWGEEDSNPRRQKPLGPKPSPFDRSGISPLIYGQTV